MTFLITMEVSTDGAVSATSQAKSMQKWLDQTFADYAENDTAAEVEVKLTALNDDERVDVSISSINPTVSFLAAGQAKTIAEHFSVHYNANGVKQTETDALAATELEESLRLIFGEAKALPGAKGYMLFQKKADALQETVSEALYEHFTIRRNAAWVALTGNTANVNFDVNS